MRRFLILVLALGLGLSTAALAAPAERHKLVVYFASWSADIDDNAGKSIDDAAKWATEHPRDVVNVVGYSSTVGSKRANALLSDLRAQVVVDQLKSKGVPSSRVKLMPKGATTYVDSPLESRRVEIFVDPK
jgi:outer membrane protein OmpA-like peptidoglycan-associated protein